MVFPAVDSCSPHALQIGDFGLPKELAKSRLQTTMIHNPRWLAPEVLEGKAYLLPSDVYSFGIIMWELLTLQELWLDEDGVSRNPFWVSLAQAWALQCSILALLLSVMCSLQIVSPNILGVLLAPRVRADCLRAAADHLYMTCT